MQNDNFLGNTRSLSELIKLKLKGNEDMLRGYALLAGIMFSPERPIETSDRFTPFVETIAREDELYESVFIADGDGYIISSSNETLVGTDISRMDYFIETVRNGKSSYTTKDVLVSESTGDLLLVHTVPIKGDKETFGLVGATFNLTGFSEEFILSNRIGETGYPYVLDDDGTIIVHPNESLLNTQVLDVDPLFKKIVDNRELSMTLAYTLNDSPKQGAFVRIPSLGWTVCLAINDEEAYSLSIIIRRLTSVTNVILLVVLSLTLSFYIKVRLIKKVNAVEELMGKASRGDMRERGDESGRDEISSMSRYFNTLLDSFGHFFRKLSTSLNELDDVGTNLASNMEETAAAVHQIRTNVENSLTQIDMQEQSVASTVTSVEQITQNIQSLDRNIIQQNERIQEGSAAVEEMIGQMTAVSGSTEEAEKIMRSLNESSRVGRNNLQNVSEIVTDISDKSHNLEEANSLIAGIAAQTNLLAMNAAIEAAHAGNAGRGFAVVADEIRKLAEQSTKQSTEVKNSIADINGSIQKVVQGSETTEESFGLIQRNMDQMARITTEIKLSLEEQVAGSSQVLQSLVELRNMGKEVSIGSAEMTDGNKLILDSVGRLTQITQEVSQAINEIGIGMEEINQAVASVTDLSQINRSSIESVRREAAYYRYEEEEEQEESH